MLNLLYFLPDDDDDDYADDSSSDIALYIFTAFVAVLWIIAFALACYNCCKILQS